MQYLECTKPLNGLDEKLNCVCLRWATEDEIFNTLKNIEENHNDKFIETGEWFDIVPFNTIASSIHVLRSNFGIAPFTEQLPWPYNRLCTNRLYRQTTGFNNEH